MEQQVGFEDIAIIYRHLNLWKTSAYKELGLSPAEGPIVNLVCENPGVSQQELSEILSLEKSVVAKSVAKLIKEGLLTREKNVEDKRAYCLYPTEKALALKPKIQKAGEACMASLMEGLNEEEKKTFWSTLKKVESNASSLSRQK